MKKMMAAAAVMAAVAAGAAGLDVRPLPWQAQGRFDATHEVQLDFRSFTNAAENAAQTLEVALAGPCQYRFAGAVLDAPFGSALTTNAVTPTVTVAVAGADVVTNAAVGAGADLPQRAWAPASAAYTALTNGATATVTVAVGAPGSGVSLSGLTSGGLRVFLRILAP